MKIKLKYISNINMGQSPDQDSINQEGVGTPFLQGKAEFGDSYPTPVNYCVKANKFSKPNDILMSVRAPVGSLNLSNQKYAIGRGLCSITPNNNIDRDYLWYGLIEANSRLLTLVKGSTFEAVTTEDVKNLEIEIPLSVEEQQKISNFLFIKDKEISDLIVSKIKLIKLLEQQRQSIITEAVTKGLNPNVKMKDSGIERIGEIPELWDATKIIYYSKLLTGGTPDKDNSLYWENGHINWMASGEVNKEFVYEVNSKITELGMRNSAAKVLPVNSVMMALNGQGKTKGKVAVLKTETTCNQSLAAFVCNEDKLHYLYLYYYLKSKYKEIRGLVGDGLRDGISLGLLKSLRMPLPTVKEQQEIANYLYNYDVEINKLISKNEGSIKLLKEYRQSLIYEAVTGKIDVCKLELD